MQVRPATEKTEQARTSSLPKPANAIVGANGFSGKRLSQSASLQSLSQGGLDFSSGAARSDLAIEDRPPQADPRRPVS